MLVPAVAVSEPIDGLESDHEYVAALTTSRTEMRCVASETEEELTRTCIVAEDGDRAKLVEEDEEPPPLPEEEPPVPDEEDEEDEEPAIVLPVPSLYPSELSQPVTPGSKAAKATRPATRRAVRRRRFPETGRNRYMRRGRKRKSGREAAVANYW